MLRRFLCPALLAACFSAEAFEVSCPEMIVTSQETAPQAGWNAFVRPTHGADDGRRSRLLRIDLYDGDPKEIVQLRPDDDERAIWSFSEPSPAGRPLYMACVYSDTYIQFVKALPLKVKQCEAKGGVLRCEEFKP